MKCRMQMSAAVIELITVLLFCWVNTAVAQEHASVYGSFILGPLCQNAGTTHAACKGTWQGPDGTESVGVSNVASDTWGYVKAIASADVNCGVGCQISAVGEAEADFLDAVYVQNAPPQGAYLRIAISSKGTISNLSTTSTIMQLDVLDEMNHRAECYVSNPAIGTCHASLSVSGPTTQLFIFRVFLGGNAGASLYGGPGTDSEYANLYGKVTELAVVDGNGKIIQNVIITTTSGHEYPL